MIRQQIKNPNQKGLVGRNVVYLPLCLKIYFDRALQGWKNNNSNMRLQEGWTYFIHYILQMTNLLQNMDITLIIQLVQSDGRGGL